MGWSLPSCQELASCQPHPGSLGPCGAARPPPPAETALSAQRTEAFRGPCSAPAQLLGAESDPQRERTGPAVLTGVHCQHKAHAGTMPDATSQAWAGQRPPAQV